MDYLKGNATASAGALYVICRHITALGTAVSPDDLRAGLRPLQEQQASDRGSDRSTDALATSLRVGQGLGALTEQAGAGWSVDPAIAVGLTGAVDDWAWFRADLLRRINSEAVASIERGEKPSDLVLAMAWFMQQDALVPLGSAFGQGAEKTIGELQYSDGKLVKAVETKEQWLAFRRWAIALGLARNVETPGAKVIVADASTAIADQFPVLPASDRAEDWLAQLVGFLPILGASKVLAALPTPRAGWGEIAPALALGLLKLEKAGVITMAGSDDGRGIVAVGLGGETRQVGIITVTGATA